MVLGRNRTLAAIPTPKLKVIFSGPVRLCPDIFESAAFSFRIEKFPHPHTAYSWKAD